MNIEPVVPEYASHYHDPECAHTAGSGAYPEVSERPYIDGS
jgi:hypothetical protein